MPFFTEQMEMLTNELRTSTRERAAFVTQVQDVTHKHLAEAQTFLRTLAQEHGAMAEHLRHVLTKDREEQCAAAKKLRKKYRDELKGMRKELQQLLKLTRDQRQQQLTETRAEFRTAREAVVSDLRQAAQVWRQRSQTRTKVPGIGTPRGKESGMAASTTHVEHGHSHGHSAIPEPKTGHGHSAVPESKSGHSRSAISDSKAGHETKEAKSHKNHR